MDTLSLEAAWKPGYIKTQLRRRLREQEPFLVTSALGWHREIVKDFLHRREVPYAFFEDAPNKWLCRVGSQGALTYHQGDGPAQTLLAPPDVRSYEKSDFA